MTAKAPAEEVIRDMIAAACPDAPPDVVHQAAVAVVDIGMHREPTEEDAESLRQRFGTRLQQMGDSEIVEVHRVTGKYKYTGIVIKGQKITGADRATLGRELKRRYESGESIRSLAASTGRSYGFVHRLLSEAGVSLRGRNSLRISRSQGKFPLPTQSPPQDTATEDHP